MSKDWKGNSESNFKTMAANNHSEADRETYDYYATEPKAVRLLLSVEKFEGTIWECACGEGHLSEEMKKDYTVYSTDIIDRGYGDGVFDFLGIENINETPHNIVTNPPYKYANEFITKALQIIQNGKKIAFFLPLRYMEGKERKYIFKNTPPHTIYVSSSRLKCALNGDFKADTGNAVAYAWYVWQKGYNGTTQVKWIN